MPCYYKCNKKVPWKPVHDDPMVVEACERIIAGGEPTPKDGETYTEIGRYYKGELGKPSEYEGLLLKEFDWSEYEIMCSDGVLRNPVVYWNKENFEYVGEEFIPDTFIPANTPVGAWEGFPGDLHVETSTLCLNIKIPSDERAQISGEPGHSGANDKNGGDDI